MAQITLGAGFLNPEKKELGIEMTKVLQKYNIKSIDTSRVYENGGSEEFLGSIEAAKKYSITTKAICGFESAGRKETILESSQVQFAALKTDKAKFTRTVLDCNSLISYQVDIYLLHGPDTATPIEETLEAIDILHKAGRRHL